MQRQCWKIFLSGAAIVIAGAAAYHNSFSGPFILDDAWNIAANPTIRHLWPPGRVLTPPRDLGVGGRPIYNLSLALNYAWGGTRVRGYHVVNLLIHLLAGLTLFGIVRRTLVKIADGRMDRPYPATLPAMAAALIWTVHPLLTESVTYLSERSESLMGLFYLLTLYCFIRWTSSFAKASADGSADKEAGDVGWAWLAVAACLLGMATKEVMVTAPAIVFLYDRTFSAGSFREAWRQRRMFYLGLAATWLVLAHLMTGSGEHGIGFGGGVSAGSYALTECRVVVEYLRLAIWPHPLVLDYDLQEVRGWTEVWPQALLLGILGIGSAVLLLRRGFHLRLGFGGQVGRQVGGQVLGFAGAWFFLTLAPTSSFVPIGAQPMAENRMYLPLAAVVVVAAAGIWLLGHRLRWLVCAAIAVVFILLTVQRNAVYASGLSLWRDTVAHCPQSARAHANLGAAFYRAGEKTDALAQFEEAASLNPDNALTHLMLGNLLAESGRTAEALAQYQAALRIDPGLSSARERMERLR